MFKQLTLHQEFVMGKMATTLPVSQKFPSEESFVRLHVEINL